MEKRDKEMPYEVIIQERNKVDLYGNVVYYIYWFGSKLGEEKFKVSMPIYKTAEDAAQETNPVQYEVLNIESFSLKYLPYLVWDGIQFCGWLWDGSRPVKRATREPLRVCKIYGGKVTFVDYSGNEYYAEHFRRFYQTAKQCREANKPKIVMLDEATDDTIFFYCNGLEELKSLAEFGGEDFIVTDFWNFIDKSDDYEKDSDNR